MHLVGAGFHLTMAVLLLARAAPQAWAAARRDPRHRRSARACTVLGVASLPLAAAWAAGQAVVWAQLAALAAVGVALCWPTRRAS